MRVRRGLLLASAVALALVAACGGPSAPTGTAPPGAVVVASQGELFIPSSVTAPAGEAFVLYFDNRDNALHNVRVVDGSGTTKFNGELFTGPSSRTGTVPALAAGTYKLLCDVHPGMTGELVAN